MNRALTTLFEQRTPQCPHQGALIVNHNPFPTLLQCHYTSALFVTVFVTCLSPSLSVTRAHTMSCLSREEAAAN